MAEIAYSTRAIDLHQKRTDYQRSGVREYIVLTIEEPELTWFRFRPQGRIRSAGDGVCRSRAFPGLWIAVEALLQEDRGRVSAVLRQGLESGEHARFVRLLQRRHENRRGKG